MYPETERIEIEDKIHDLSIKDPYRWLETFDDPKVQQWLEKQHQYFDSIMNKIPNFKNSVKRILDLLSIGSLSAPIIRNDFIFYTKQTTENQPILYVQKGISGKPEVLIDPNELSKEKPVALDWFYISPNSKYIVYGLSEEGNEWSLLHIMEISTRKLLDDQIPRTKYSSLTWLSDESGFYYTRYPIPGSVPDGQEHYNTHVLFHKIGTDWMNDPKIFGEGRSPQNHYAVELSDDDRYLLITILMYTKNDLYIMDLKNGNKLFEVIVGDDSLTFGTFLDDELWVNTNKNAPKGAVFKASIKKPSFENWEDVISEDDQIISQVLVTKNKIFLRVMKNASDYIEVYTKNGDHLTELDLPSYSSMLSMGTNSTIHADNKISEFYFKLESFFYPNRIYRYEINDEKLLLFNEIESPINPDDYVVKQIWYESKDGTKVPMFLVHKNNIKLDGKNPTLLGGYGGFNLATKPPYFKYSRFFWLERGGILALANLRGGSEFGEEWHKGGMLDKKQNVFDDFIYAARWLIDNKYASNKTLAISGRSNGGLLTGAAVTQEPDLFAAVYIGVPLLDMIRYQLFKIARYWIPEYGSSENPNQFKYLLEYSPYHNVGKGTSYPATILVTAASDSRVDANHAMKMTAMMQWANSSKEPIILFVEREAGHGVGKPLEKLAKTEADLYIFLGWKTGLEM